MMFKELADRLSQLQSQVNEQITDFQEQTEHKPAQRSEQDPLQHVEKVHAVVDEIEGIVIELKQTTETRLNKLEQKSQQDATKSAMVETELTKLTS